MSGKKNLCEASRWAAGLTAEGVGDGREGTWEEELRPVLRTSCEALRGLKGSGKSSTGSEGSVSQERE